MFFVIICKHSLTEVQRTVMAYTNNRENNINLSSTRYICSLFLFNILRIFKCNKLSRHVKLIVKYFLWIVSVESKNFYSICVYLIGKHKRSIMIDILLTD